MPYIINIKHIELFFSSLKAVKIKYANIVDIIYVRASRDDYPPTPPNSGSAAIGSMGV